LHTAHPKEGVPFGIRYFEEHGGGRSGGLSEYWRSGKKRRGGRGPGFRTGERESVKSELTLGPIRTFNEKKGGVTEKKKKKKRESGFIW